MLVERLRAPRRAATRGADQFRGGQYARAAASYRAAIADGDQRPEMLYNLGTALVAADSLDRALEPLERSTLVEREELRYRSLFNLGLAHLKTGWRALATRIRRAGRSSSAVELYKRVLLMRPGDGDAQWNYELALTESEPDRRPVAVARASRRNEPEQQPDPRDPPSPSLGREQAEQLLSSAARDEQAVQGRKQRESRPTAPRRGKDW